MRSRAELEAAVIARYRKMAVKWGVSEKEAEKKAIRYLPSNSDKELREFLKTPQSRLTANILDPAHRATEKKIDAMTSKVSAAYSQAAQEMQEKLEAYLETFSEADKRMQQNVADGLMTEDQYTEWRESHMMQAERWQQMRDTLAADASNSNDIARSIIQGYMPDVYAENFNYGTYEIESFANIDTTFTLYDRQTVERLMRDDAKLLPDPAKGSKTALAIAKNKDLAWNKRHIQAELLQGILQGESIDKIAKRMRNVEKMNKTASIRYARTMTTGAENAGRIDSYKRANDMGIDLEPAWMSTLDNRTRDSHRQLDGETRDAKSGKFSNGCRYPGDPDGTPAETYNCRCCLVAQIKGFEFDFTDTNWRNTYKMSDMTYEDWKNGKRHKSG